MTPCRLPREELFKLNDDYTAGRTEQSQLVGQGAPMSGLLQRNELCDFFKSVGYRVVSFDIYFEMSDFSYVSYQVYINSVF